MPRSWSQQDRHRARRVFEASLVASADLREASRAAGVSLRTGRRWRNAVDATGERTTPCPASRRCTSFEGRQSELEALDRLLEGGKRLVTILGAPGVGKTRLALRWTETRSEQDPGFGEVFFCDLRGARDEEALHTELGRRLDVQLPSGAGPTAEALGSLLKARQRCWVVLDNFEELVEAGATAVAFWLLHAPEARFLLTSRRVLRLQSETVFDLGPLPLPGETEDERAWEENDAMRLFWTRAHDAEPALRRSSLPVRAAAELVGHLDGIPLALELAASQVRRVGLPALLRDVRESVLSLETQLVDVDADHATLSAAIARSWRLLENPDRMAMARLTVFRNGFSLDGAAAVLNQDTASTSRILATLREASLVRVLEDDDLLGRRYDLFEAIREYAGQRLPKVEEHHARGRHAGYYLNEGEQRSEDLHTSEGFYARRWLHVELGNLEAAFATQVAASDNSADRVPRLAMVLHHAFADWMPSRAIETISRALDPLGPPSDRLIQARLLLARASVHREAGLVESAERDLDTVDGFLRATDPNVPLPAEWSRIRTEHGYETGLLAFYSGRSVAARSALQNALIQAREHHFGLLEGRVHVALAWVLGDDFHDPTLFEHYHRAVHVFRRCGNRRKEAWARLWWTSHRICFQRARREEDVVFLERESSAFRTGDRALAVWATLALSYYYRDEGQLEEARRYAEQAAHLAKRAGLDRASGVAAFSRALVESEAGHLDQASACYEEAAEIHARDGNVRQRAVGALMQAGLRARQDDLPAAERHFNEATAHMKGCGDLRWKDLHDLQRGLLEVAEARCAYEHGDFRRALLLERQAQRRMRVAREPRHLSKGTLPPLAQCSMEARHILRLLDRELEHRVTAGWTLEVARDGSRFTFGPAAESPLPEGTVTRAALLALVDRRLSDPGVPLERRELLARCWPGERMLPESETRRVRDAIKRLRRLGLEGLLLTGRRGGYFLDPGVSVSVCDP